MESEDKQTKMFMDLWKWMDAHKKQVLWGAILVVVIGLCVGYFIWQQGQKEITANTALSTVMNQSLLGGEMRLKSADELVKLVAQYPGTAASQRALLLAGSRFFNDGKLPEAKAQFDQYLRQYPGSPFAGQAMFGAAVVAEAQGKTSDAMTTYKNIIDRYPSDNVAPQAKFALGRLNEAQGNLVQARDYYLQIERPEYGLVGSQASLQLRGLFEKHPELLPNQPPPAPASTNAPVLRFNPQP